LLALIFVVVQSRGLESKTDVTLLGIIERPANVTALPESGGRDEAQADLPLSQSAPKSPMFRYGGSAEEAPGAVR